MIEDGNKSQGGLNKVVSFYGILGFVKFLEGYYIILVTKRSAVALIGGHNIYHVDDTIMVPIPGPSAKIERRVEEQRYLQIFTQVDLNKNFYFSYTYDITQTLQHNLTRPNPPNISTAVASSSSVISTEDPGGPHFEYKEMFVWNDFLLRNGFGDYISNQTCWALPIINGFVDQAKISVFGHNIFVALIARRSRFFAGARFLKRGVNDYGYVANDVETEQIVFDASTTSFYTPRGFYGSKPAYTSFVQHRGSIPLYWSQDTSSMAPKPPIEQNLIDPYYSAPAAHFNDMFRRYGTPIIVLNLIKTHEKTPRESNLAPDFAQSIEYLNQFLPEDKKIRYVAWDMSRASKSADQDVIGWLEDFADDVLETTGFFHSGPEPFINALRRARDSAEVNRILGRRQNGVVRVNCIDCLDRTNAAQFVIGKRALGEQLYAIGVLSHPSVPFDSDATTILNAMYHDHGDTIALQYGGSHLVNTMETYRKISPSWTSHSRDMIESIRRFYSNAFSDAEKQDAINLFLGNYIPTETTVHLWELPSDYYLHNESPQFRRPKQSYVQWWTRDALFRKGHNFENYWLSNIQIDDGYFMHYYRPRMYTTFKRLFAYRMMGTHSNRPSNREENMDLSPFTVRANPSQSTRYFMMYSLNIGGVKRILRISEKNEEAGRYAQDGRKDKGEDPTRMPLDSSSPWWTTSSLATRLLDPQVPPSELREYRRYINQFKPNSITLITSIETPPPVPATTSMGSSPPPTGLPDYQPITSIPTDMNSRQPVDEAWASHADYQTYSSYVSENMSLSVCSKKIEPRDDALYVAYATTIGKTSTYVGPGAKSQTPRYEAYAKWLSTGKFVSARPKNPKA
ncbi:polyphosphoinositide phosphatase [Cladochytrium replicatum]|nr:polyphosphoinositide phosphatase [Cladochytrium replicatum]